MIKTGSYNTLTIVKFTPQGLYLSEAEGADQILLPGKYITDSMREGDAIRVFVYRDSLDRPVATTQTPFATADQFACLAVKETTTIGAFLDWGLEKDLLVPFKLMNGQLTTGKRYVFRIIVDAVSDRIIATNRLDTYFNRDVSDLAVNQKASAMVYENREFGSLAILDGRYSGLFHRGEFKKSPQIGSILTAYVKRISADGKIDITLAPAGKEGAQEAQQKILLALEKAGRFLPLHDKTPAEEIEKSLGMSKKTFKKLVGNLLKKNLIALEDKGIRKIQG